MLKKIKYVLNNEEAGPTVENVIALIVAIMVVIALGLLAAALFYYVAGAKNAVYSLK